MKYLLVYYTSSRYLHYTRKHIQEFKTFNDVRNFLILNVNNIKNYLIYRLTDLTNK